MTWILASCEKEEELIIKAESKRRKLVKIGVMSAAKFLNSRLLWRHHSD